MYTIEISNRQSALPIDADRLIHVAQAVLAGEQVAAATITIGIVDDPTIHDLNRRFLNHDEATDVLSFLLSDNDAERAGSVSDGVSRATVANASGSFSYSPASPRLEGDVIVSADTAARMAPQFGWTADDELLLYVVHGLLHLIGFDDLAPEAREEMRAAERKYMEICGSGIRQEFRGHTVGI